MNVAQSYIVYHNPYGLDYETIEFLINEKLSPVGGFFDGDTFIFRTQVIAVSAMCLVEGVILLPIDAKHNTEYVSASYENDYIDKTENLSWEELAKHMIDFN